MKVCYYLCDQANTRKSKGIRVYTLELLSSLARKNCLEMVVLTSQDGPKIPGAENVVLPVKTGSIPSRLITDHLHPCVLPEADIYHYPKGFLPFFSPNRALRIASILDTIGVHYYDKYRGNNSIYKPFELEYWLLILTRTLRQADAVITISNRSAESIRKYCDQRGVKTPPLYVTYLASKFQGISSSALVTTIKKEYVLHFASDLPHKRTGWLLEIWRQGLKSGKSLPELRLVGKLGQVHRLMIESTSGVTLLPYLDDDSLRSAICEARALIYPSEIEGFGLPALEAYQLGTPVLYVAGTSVAEIMSLDGVNVPGCFTLDYDDFWRAFDEVMAISDSLLITIQQELRLRFSWEKTAEQTVDIYRNLSI